MKELTLSDLIAKANRLEQARKIDIPALGGSVTAHRLPTRRFAELSSVSEDDLGGQIAFSEKLIYESVPMFRSKELKEATGNDGAPEEVVSKMLTMDEITEVINQILPFYTSVKGDVENF